MSSLSPACCKRRLNGTVSWNNRITLKNPTKCLWHWEPERRSNATSMCRHIYNWNIVAYDVKQPLKLKTRPYILIEVNNWEYSLPVWVVFVIFVFIIRSHMFIHDAWVIPKWHCAYILAIVFLNFFQHMKSFSC